MPTFPWSALAERSGDSALTRSGDTGLKSGFPAPPPPSKAASRAGPLFLVCRRSPNDDATDRPVSSPPKLLSRVGERRAACSDLRPDQRKYAISIAGSGRAVSSRRDGQHFPNDFLALNRFLSQHPIVFQNQCYRLLEISPRFFQSSSLRIRIRHLLNNPIYPSDLFYTAFNCSSSSLLYGVIDSSLF